MRINREEYTDHINDPIKKIEIRKILDKIETVLNRHTIEATDFLDPYEMYLAKSALNSFMDLDYHKDGGYSEAERNIITLYPEYIFKEDIGQSISSLKIEGYSKGTEHKDFLGAILNLGLKRNKIGDILVYDDYCIVIVKDEIKDYILYNLEKIKRSKVNVSVYECNKIIPPEGKYNEIDRFLSSLRLDSAISAAFNLSRKESMDSIKNGDVKVNFENIEKPSEELDEGDLISVRGYGRFLLYNVKGKSKRDKYICVIRIIL